MSNLPWDSPAQAALKRAPLFVRPLVRRKVEERVRAAGGRRVALADFQEAEARFRAVLGGRGEEELKNMMPTDNTPGARMVVVQSCRSELAGCPNAFIDTSAWRAAVEQWVAEAGLSERLRSRVKDDKLLFHHKLRIAIAGCPNGCSRPQIADLAVVGAAEPIFDDHACTGCGLCQEACPDQAIAVEGIALGDPSACQGCKSCRDACEFDAVSLGDPFARVLIGGKLGRHPHLADLVEVVDEPARALAVFGQAVDQFLEQSRPGQRFSAWWAARDRQGAN